MGRRFGACLGCARAGPLVETRHRLRGRAVSPQPAFNHRSFGMDGRATGGILRAGGTPRDGGILRFFRDVPDPRASNVVHKLHDILVLAICGVICGADGWVEVAEFGNSKLAWFRTFLELPGGPPSHDTFGRVFARLDPDAFERRFTA